MPFLKALVQLVVGRQAEKGQISSSKHFSHNSGNILYGKCTVKAGAGGYCK